MPKSASISRTNFDSDAPSLANAVLGERTDALGPDGYIVVDDEWFKQHRILKR
jgi:hypothetical protein